MLKKTIEYVDYNNITRKEDYYFNLSKAEITEMEMGVKGGLTETITRIVAAQDSPAIIKIFKDLILKAYGVKSPDGKRFEKSEELSTEFAQTEAYSNLFMELAFDANKAAEFINGIVPADLAKEAAKEAKKRGLPTVS